MTAFQTVRLVAGRELGIALRAKGTIITTAIMVVLIIGGLFLLKFLDATPTVSYGALDDTKAIAQSAAQTLEAQGIETKVHHFDSVAQGHAAIEADDIEGLIVREGKTVSLDVNEGAGSQLLDAISGAAQQEQIQGVANEYGSDAVSALTDVFTTGVATNVLNPPTELDGSQMIVGFISKPFWK